MGSSPVGLILNTSANLLSIPEGSLRAPKEPFLLGNPPKFGLFIKSALLEEAARPLGGPSFGAHLKFSGGGGAQLPKGGFRPLGSVPVVACTSTCCDRVSAGVNF